MKLIYVLLGQTNSGKTTLLNILKSMGYSTITPYTTRPIREGEIDGVDYRFISKNRYNFLSYINLLISKFKAENGTEYGIDIRDLKEEKDCLVTLDPSGLRDLIERYGEDSITSIYLKVPYEERKQRGEKRDKDNHTEFLRRLSSDKRDFENIEKIVDHIITDQKTDKVLLKVLKIINPVVYEDF